MLIFARNKIESNKTKKTEIKQQAKTSNHKKQRTPRKKEQKTYNREIKTCKMRLKGEWIIIK